MLVVKGTDEPSVMPWLCGRRKRRRRRVSAERAFCKPIGNFGSQSVEELENVVLPELLPHAL